MLQAAVLKKETIPDLLGDDGFIKLLPSAKLKTINHNALRLWCFYNARYGVPTQELIVWLKNLIGQRRAIEIGAGSGDLAHHLDIPATDNWLQERPDIAEYYDALKQPRIRYGKNVEKLDADEAIEKYKPEVVIGSWITHWIDPSLPFPDGGGSTEGIKEDKILDTGATYVMIGNLDTHGCKPILKRLHDVHNYPFVYSRGVNPRNNRIFVWNR